ncbi:MAG: hypothetical protein DRP30_03270 [Thermotoga sp.]|nr:MAG: hypothetical protein DRP30_03270 [Thermotoga sp.]
MREYIPLGVHSVYSILSSSIRLEDLVKRSIEYGYRAVGLVDENFSSHLKFKELARSRGIKPILGLDIETSFGRFVVLSKNLKGYRNLIKLNNLNQTGDLKFEEFIELLDENVLLLKDGRFMDGKSSEFENLLKLKDVYLTVSPTGEEDLESSKRMELAESYGIPVVLYFDVRFMEGEREIFDTLRKIGARNVHGFPFQSMDEIFRRFSHFGREIENTVRIANEIDEFELEIPFEFPKFSENDSEFLRMEVYRGLKRIYGEPLPSKVKERAERELNLIMSRNLESYFLCVKEIIDTARSLGMMVGPGRGSAVGSIVSYALGITKIDPLKYDLIFERFLNEYRTDFPDIDIDVQDDERQMLLKKLGERFGKWRFMQIVTFGTMGEKLALREIIRIRDLDRKTADGILSGRVKDHEILDLAKKLEGIPHHLSIHAAGVIISGTDLMDKIPVFLEESSLISQFDMGDLEKMGIVKIDVLGLRTLSFIRNMLDEVGISDPMDIPLDDEKTYEIFSKGLTTSIFQMEAPFARKLAIMMKPRNIDDISIMIALNRPGPIQSNLVSDFLKSRRKTEGEFMFEMLEETSGIPVFQEQIMRISMELCGFTPTQADEFRRAISKKDPEKMEAYREKFIDGLMKRGYDEQKANEIFDIVMNFSNYAFNKSHSVAYSHISYWSAYFKANYPSLFFKMAFNYNAGDHEKLEELMSEAPLFGLKVSPPDINESDVGVRSVENKLILGFGFIKGIGRSIGSKIVKERERFGKFEDLRDAVGRLGEFLNHDQMMNLVRSGAFDSLSSEPRSEILRKVKEIYDGKAEDMSEIQEALFGSIIKERNERRKKEKSVKHDPMEKVLFEFESLGFSPSLFDLNLPAIGITSVLEGFLGNPGFTKVKVMKIGEGKFFLDGKTVLRNEISEILQEGDYILIFGEKDLESVFNLNKLKLVLEFERKIDETDVDDLISNMVEDETSEVVLKVGRFKMRFSGYAPKDPAGFSMKVKKAILNEA